MHRRTLVVASLGAHAALAFALFAAGIWHLQRLDPERRRFDLAVAAPPPPPPAGSPAAAHALKIAPKVHRRIVHEPVQPTVTSEVQVVEDTGAGSGDGSGSGTGSGSGSGSGTCTLPSCGVLPQIAPPALPQQPPPLVRPTLPPRVLQALRISGDTQIEPPDDVKIAMERDGRSRTMAIFELCLDSGGNVHGVRLVRSSGYSGYDQRLTEAMWRWRYHPYRVAGQAVPACGVVTFDYATE